MSELKHPLAEKLLAYSSGAERGTAIYGDLVELATARSRRWFWMAYARTMVSLTWRPVTGFGLALAVVAAVNRLEYGNEWQRFVYFHFPHRWRGIPFNRAGLPFYNFLYTATSAASVTAWLLASYAAVKYGIRDRMAQAALVLSLILTSAMSLATEWPVALSLVALALVATGYGLLISAWRGAFAGMIASMAWGTVITGCLYWVQRMLTMQVLLHHRQPIHHPPYLLFGFVPEFWAVLILDMSLVASMTQRVRRQHAETHPAATA